MYSLSWLAILSLPGARGFLSLPPMRAAVMDRGGAAHDSLSSSTMETAAVEYVPVLDFTQPETMDQVDRLDDAIMGGISTSAVIPGDGCAKWGGVCRTDGGGFCGFRTNPFNTPLQPGNATGLYVECRLASDDEPERRVWKITTRTKPDRGELLYQAPMTSLSAKTFTKVELPFSSFQLVRGPTMVKEGPPLNTSSGLFQLGMTMSKFAWNRTGEIENFRDGFFEVQIKSMGLYYDESEVVKENTFFSSSQQPEILSRGEAKKKKSLLFKVLGPIVRLVFFSEASQRRKSAMRILRVEQKLSRLQAIRWGLRWRRKNSGGLVQAAAGVLKILAMDTLRTLVRTCFRVVTYPLVLLFRLVRQFRKSPSTEVR